VVNLYILKKSYNGHTVVIRWSYNSYTIVLQPNDICMTAKHNDN